MPLARPETLRPLVGELAAALESGERAPTESSTQCLASGLARALDLPPVRVKALAARPHARWGELHGLYETTGRPADTPLITLWMRTARQKRVVAFRTFLRTLLHEIGHVDYTRLRLGDSFAAQGFYQRESHLFPNRHRRRTVNGHPRGADGAHGPHGGRSSVGHQGDARPSLLTKRPDDKNWFTHRGAMPPARYEESFMTRFQTIMAWTSPGFPRSSPTAGHRSGSTSATTRGRRWPAFRLRRAESLKFLRALRPEQMARGSLHATRGRMTIADFVGLVALTTTTASTSSSAPWPASPERPATSAVPCGASAGSPSCCSPCARSGGRPHRGGHGLDRPQVPGRGRGPRFRPGGEPRAPVHDPHPHAVDVKPSQIAELEFAALLVRAGLSTNPGSPACCRR